MQRLKSLGWKNGTRSVELGFEMGNINIMGRWFMRETEKV